MIFLITKRVFQHLKANDRFVLVVGAAGLFGSLSLHLMAFALGLNEAPAYAPKEYHTYIDSLNWSLHPVFFIIVPFIVERCWIPFIGAINDTSGALFKERFNNIDKRIVENNYTTISGANLEKLIAEVKNKRKSMIVLAAICATVFVYIDTQEVLDIYNKNKQALIQVIVGKKDPDFFERWIWSAPEKTRQQIVNNSHSSEINEINPTNMDWVILIYAYFLEFLLLLCGFLILLQTIFQATFFILVEYTKTGQKIGLKFFLDGNDQLGEWGLRKYNMALDYVYWFIGCGLCVPLLSQHFNSHDDIGQKMADGLLFFLVPLSLLTIWLVRNNLKNQALQLAELTGGELAINTTKQSLWPIKSHEYYGILFALLMLTFNISPLSSIFLKFI